MANRRIYILFACLVSFCCSLQLEAQRVNKSQELLAGKFNVKMVSDVELSSDGKFMIFEAIGKIWIQKYGRSKAEQLDPNNQDFQYHPSFSKDGKRIIYASWNPNGFGKLIEYDIKEKKKKTLVITSGIYKYPNYSHDGSMLVYKKELESSPTDTIQSANEGVYLLLLHEKVDPALLSIYGDYPTFSEDDSRIYFEAGEYKLGTFLKTFESIDLNGSDKQVHHNGKYGHEYLFSKDRKRVVWQELGKVYLSNLENVQSKTVIAADNQKLEKDILSALPANNLHWSHDGKHLNWNIANTHYSIDVRDVMNGKQKLKTEKIVLQGEKDIPEGTLALTNATILTMDGDKVVEHGTIIIKENKIVDVGFDVKVPKEAHAIDCSGKTIMPGLISTDPRSNNYEYKLDALQQWEFLSLLQNGITTKVDGNFRIKSILHNIDLVKTGKLVGPRLLCGGIRIADFDKEIFSDESFLHYKASNLLLAEAFDVASLITSDDEVAAKGFLSTVVSPDTNLVKASDIHEEMLSHSEEGYSNGEILRKYTSETAQLLGYEEALGKIKTGMLADLIILAENPLKNINATRAITKVIINGRIYDTVTMDEQGNYRQKIKSRIDPSIYNSVNRTMGSACCGFQH